MNSSSAADPTGGITFPITAGSRIYHPARRYHLKSRMHNVSLMLCSPSGDFTFQISFAQLLQDPPERSTSTGSVASVNTIPRWSPELPMYQSQGFFDVPQLGTNLPLEPLPLVIDPPLTVPAGAGNTPSASEQSTQFSSPLSSIPASSHPPSPEAIIADTIGSASHTSNRGMSARTNYLATARTHMTGRYNRHHQWSLLPLGNTSLSGSHAKTVQQPTTSGVSAVWYRIAPALYRRPGRAPFAPSGDKCPASPFGPSSPSRSAP